LLPCAYQYDRFEAHVKRQQTVPRLLHRARTALRAASDRSVGVNLAARAATALFAPVSPPIRRRPLFPAFRRQFRLPCRDAAAGKPPWRVTCGPVLYQLRRPPAPRPAPRSTATRVLDRGPFPIVMPQSAGLGLARATVEIPAAARGTWFDMCPGRGAKSEDGRG
jgi:hypothetical protein